MPAVRYCITSRPDYWRRPAAPEEHRLFLALLGVRRRQRLTGFAPGQQEES